jgi:hypothetical protein
MWICTNKAFLSVVQPKSNDPEAAGIADPLLVRARVKGHIEAVFPGAKVLRRPGRDYLYRAYIQRTVVAQVIAQQLAGIGYDNFKNSVADDELHRAYASTWSIMGRLQYVPPYGSDSPAARRKEQIRLSAQEAAARGEPAPKAKGKAKRKPAQNTFWPDADPFGELEAGVSSLPAHVEEYLDAAFPCSQGL